MFTDVLFLKSPSPIEIQLGHYLGVPVVSLPLEFGQTYSGVQGKFSFNFINGDVVVDRIRPKESEKRVVIASLKEYLSSGKILYFEDSTDPSSIVIISKDYSRSDYLTTGKAYSLYQNEFVDRVNEVLT